MIIRILLAAPSDVNREAVRTAIHSWNERFTETTGVTLIPRMDTHDATPSLAGSAQDVVNTQLVDQADLLIAVFWTRAGTPTDRAISGTAEEIDRFVKRGWQDRVMVYRSAQPIDPQQVDPAQLATMDTLLNSLGGYIPRIKDMHDLCDRLLNDLTQKVQWLLNQREQLDTRPSSSSTQLFDQVMTEALSLNHPGYWLSIVLDWGTSFLPMDSTLKQKQTQWAQALWKAAHKTQATDSTWEPHFTAKRVRLTGIVHDAPTFQYDSREDGVIRVGFGGTDSVIPLRWIWHMIGCTRDTFQYFPQLTSGPKPLQHLGLVLANGPDGGIATDRLFSCTSTRPHHLGFQNQLMQKFIGPETWVHLTKEFSEQILSDQGYLYFEDPIRVLNFDMVTDLDNLFQ